MKLTEEQHQEIMKRIQGTKLSVAQMKEPAKYRNTKTEVDGIKFDSKLEARYSQLLDLEWYAGEVLWYIRQVPFRLTGGVIYRADFVVVRPDGVEVVDTTGFMTPAKRNKLKQVLAIYGIKVKVVTRVS